MKTNARKIDLDDFPAGILDLCHAALHHVALEDNIEIALAALRAG